MGFIITILSDIPFGLVGQYNNNVHVAWMALIDKHKVSESKNRA